MPCTFGLVRLGGPFFSSGLPDNPVPLVSCSRGFGVQGDRAVRVLIRIGTIRIDKAGPNSSNSEAAKLVGCEGVRKDS